jgi:DNA-binding GntR family transcriptional regulator
VIEELTLARRNLSQLQQLDETVKLDRTLLKDEAADILRNHIFAGRIPEGTRLTELAVAEMLGISRMPAREALMLLEAEGLVERRSDGRHVIELNEDKIRDLHQVRWALERLAVELAVANANEANRAALDARYRDLKEAVTTGDPALCARCDLAIHQTIWEQAHNSYLLQALGSVLGVNFVLAARVRVYEGDQSDKLLSLHGELVEQVGSGNRDEAIKAIEAHSKEFLGVSLLTFHIQEHGDTSDS